MNETRTTNTMDKECSFRHQDIALGMLTDTNACSNLAPFYDWAVFEVDHDDVRFRQRQEAASKIVALLLPNYSRHQPTNYTLPL